MTLLQSPKRLLLGSPLRSDRLGETLLRKRVALPIFASDPLSSVAYAPQEIFLVLSVAGVTYYSYSFWFAVAVAVLMATVVASYRQNVHAYPGGGGDYEVARRNLGEAGGLTVASALLVDYVLTVAVSVAAGVDNLASAVGAVGEHKVAVALGVITLLTLVNLRGVKEAGLAFALPTYAFIAGVLTLIAVGLTKAFVLGGDLRAPTAGYEIVAEHSELTGLALVFLLMRTFASGCAALTGVEAIANGVPAFREPKSRNAATTLLVMGALAVSMFAGLILLGQQSDLRVAEHPATEILIDGAPAGPDYHQDPIIAQVAAAVFGDGSFAFVYLAAVTALILFFAANTAYNGFPLLASVLAHDHYLPRQLRQRGDRLAYSNGIVLLAVAAGALVYAFDADVTRLIQLYIIGVFVSFTLGQTGMVRHWTRLLRTETKPARRSRMVRARVINSVGLFFTGAVLVIVLVTKFTHGAYLVLIAMPILFAGMKGIRRHYDQLVDELTPPPAGVTLPSRIHSIVLISRLHTPALRALAFARATRPDTLTALTVQISPAATRALLEDWARRDIPVPLTVLDSPYRDVIGSIVEYVRAQRRESPRDVVCVFIPEYVVGHWWEQLLHNQTALRLKARLLFQPGVMVTSVPWQLGSAEGREARRAPVA
ncbi:APC family permease [Sporichthya polymorpha]|uniref:APC family permease n=1 Tax=Sporichthya polymorpha TaxID=35751 RepID=UPI000526F342|nr:APC family permease [Sporichthya polymorpha]